MYDYAVFIFIFCRPENFKSAVNVVALPTPLSKVVLTCVFLVYRWLLIRSTAVSLNVTNWR